jgi:hypothetical protein
MTSHRFTLWAVLMLLISLASIKGFAQDGLAGYDYFWQQKDSLFAYGNASPLDADAREKFDSIARYPFDPRFRIEASWEPVQSAKPQGIQTNTEVVRQMQKAGYLVFELSGSTIRLPLYRDLTMARIQVADPGYFLPFTDLTNGETTYAGGRYIDIDESRLQYSTMYIDFNLAYNPYCVYSSRYSCPIPPMENHIPLPIAAGAKFNK